MLVMFEKYICGWLAQVVKCNANTNIKYIEDGYNLNVTSIYLVYVLANN